MSKPALWQHGAVRLFLMVLVLGLATPTLAPSAGAATPGKDSPTPDAYLVGFARRGVDCTPWRDRTWVSWQTYVAGRTGDRWRGAASARGLCALARTVGRRAVAPRLVAGLRFPEALAVAANGRAIRLDNVAPAGWRCYQLPTQWSLSAYAQARDPSGDLEDAYGAAAGLAAPFGYCVSGARRQGSRWSGGRFLTFGPDAGDCVVRLRLFGRPDPASPGSETFPPFSEVDGRADRALASFYDQTPC